MERERLSAKTNGLMTVQYFLSDEGAFNLFFAREVSMGRRVSLFLVEAVERKLRCATLSREGEAQWSRDVRRQETACSFVECECDFQISKERIIRCTQYSESLRTRYSYEGSSYLYYL